MKALTVWQPWATLIADRRKPYEFRGWCPPASIVGQRIAIHAGARPVKRDEIADLILRLRGTDSWTTCLKPAALDWLELVHATPQGLTRSAIVCTAILGRPVLASTIVEEFGGTVNASDRNEHANWAWPMLDVQRLEPPLPARGAQGFWNWEGA